MVFKKVQSLYNFLSKLYVLYIIILVLAVIGGIYEYHSLTNLPNNYNPETDTLIAEYITMIIGLVQSIGVIFLLINFFRLLYRISYNLQYQFHRMLSISPGWTIGYFFIPILNLYKPYKAVKEIFIMANAKPYLKADLVGFWWLLRIASMFIGKFLIKYSIRNWGASNNTDSTIMFLLSDLFDILLYIVEFILVKQITKSYLINYENNSLLNNQSSNES